MGTEGARVEAPGFITPDLFFDPFLSCATPNCRPLGFPFLALLVSGGHCQLILCKASVRCSETTDLCFRFNHSRFY